MQLGDGTYLWGVLVSPPGDELPEFDVAITGGVRHFEVEQAFGAGDVAIENVQQDVEFVLVDEAVAIQVAGFENPARICNDSVVQRFHECSPVLGKQFTAGRLKPN